MRGELLLDVSGARFPLYGPVLARLRLGYAALVATLALGRSCLGVCDGGSEAGIPHPGGVAVGDGL